MRTLKREEVDGRAYRDRAEAKASIGTFIETVYSRHRLHSVLAYLAPEAYQANLPRAATLCGYTNYRVSPMGCMYISVPLCGKAFLLNKSATGTKVALGRHVFKMPSIRLQSEDTDHRRYDSLKITRTNHRIPLFCICV